MKSVVIFAGVLIRMLAAMLDAAGSVLFTQDSMEKMVGFLVEFRKAARNADISQELSILDTSVDRFSRSWEEMSTYVDERVDRIEEANEQDG